MATWRDVVYDVWTSLKQSFDDADIALNHVQYWVSITASRLLKQHIDKRDSGAFLTVFNSLYIQTDPTTGYKYIELPETILDFDRDGGIEYLSYSTCIDECTPPFTSVQFSRTSPSAARVLYFTEEEKPEPNNPYFYRVDNRLYLLGIECINPCGLELGIYTALDSTTCNLDDEFPLPADLLPILQKYVLDLGRFVLMMPNERVNEGTGDLTLNQVPTSKLISVNQGLSTQNDSQQQQQ